METNIKWLTKRLLSMSTCSKRMRALLTELAAAAVTAAAVLPEK